MVKLYDLRERLYVAILSVKHFSMTLFSFTRCGNGGDTDPSGLERLEARSRNVGNIRAFKKTISTQSYQSVNMFTFPEKREASAFFELKPVPGLPICTNKNYHIDSPSTAD